MTESPQDEMHETFVALFARSEQPMRAFVRSLLPPRADVDDVMQDVGLFIQLRTAVFFAGLCMPVFALGVLAESAETSVSNAVGRTDKVVMQGPAVTVSANGREILLVSDERFAGRKHNPTFRTAGPAALHLDNITIRNRGES